MWDDLVFVSPLYEHRRGSKHLPYTHPDLRFCRENAYCCRAAALTLRHLAEKDTAALLPERIEGRLFDALDAETDTEIASQLRATLATLLAMGAPSQPSYWLQVRQRL